MVQQEGVLLDLTRGTEFVFAEAVSFASREGGCMWNSPLKAEPDVPQDEGAGAGGGFGRPAELRKKLLVVTPAIAKKVSSFVEERM